MGLLFKPHTRQLGPVIPAELTNLFTGERGWFSFKTKALPTLIDTTSFCLAVWRHHDKEQTLVMVLVVYIRLHFNNYNSSSKVQVSTVTSPHLRG